MDILENQYPIIPQNWTTLVLALPSSFVLSLFPRWLTRLGRHFFWRFLP
jgi:hypothetical protein